MLDETPFQDAVAEALRRDGYRVVEPERAENASAYFDTASRHPEDAETPIAIVADSRAVGSEAGVLDRCTLIICDSGSRPERPPGPSRPRPRVTVTVPLDVAAIRTAVRRADLTRPAH